MAVDELAGAAELDALTPEQHRRFISAGGSWVAVRAGEPIGFACATMVGTDLHLWEVDVRSEEQGKGTGRRLVETVIEAARTAAARRVTLTTFTEVPWNDAFYRQLGFAPIPRERLDARLSRILEQEAAAGLPRERRCAMELHLG